LARVLAHLTDIRVQICVLHGAEGAGPEALHVLQVHFASCIDNRRCQHIVKWQYVNEVPAKAKI
jgi:hypothetical protein